MIEEEDKVSLARKRAELVESLAAPLPPEERVRVQGEIAIVNAKIKALNKTEAARNKAAADRRKVAGLAEASANAARAMAKVNGGAMPEDGDDEPEDDDPGQTKAIDGWIATVLRRGGIKTGRTSNGKLVIDGPAEWVAVIEVFCSGIYAAARGQELPDIPLIVAEREAGKAAKAATAAPKARKRS
jgi:hypothetical protein